MWCWWIYRRSDGLCGCGGGNGAGRVRISGCALRSFIEQDPTIGPQRALLTSRAARWVTVQVGRRGRPVDEVAAELGCGWHTVNNEVGRWGEALLEADTDRIGEVQAVGSRRDVVLAERPVAYQGLVHLCRRRWGPPADRHSPW